MVATSLLFTVACSGTGEEEASEVSNDVPAVELTIVPADGGSDVRPDTPVTVTATNGTIEDVQVTQSSAQGEDTESTPEEEGGDGLDAVTGTLNEDGTEWVSDWTLTPGSTVTVVATGKSASGETVEATSEFTTLEATPGQRLELQSNFPVSGDVVGVGMPIIVNFDLPVQNKAAVEAAMEVVSDKPAQGAWNWFGDRTAVFRTEEYWEPYQEVTVNMRLAGVQASEGVYGIENYQLNFEVGRSQISEIDNDTHRMVVTRDGEQIQDFPISNGDGSTRAYTTTTGVHLTMEKYQHLIMDSATVGIPEGHPDYYRLDVNYAVRISNSGEFTHAAPWNTDLGVANRSHGCTNMSTEDARWFYENSYMGDPVIITGTDRELEVDNGWGYWQRSWDEWLSHSTLGEADRTDEPGSPGSPHGTAAEEQAEAAE
ncbi:L,D-transpeptidase [Thermobifida halotolerans]|uniref:L,D-transpeptidase n=1 Tax=Thermobifida halotolerans TaxID=483545 RepID=UPI001FB50BFD|nr:Ig-like domain-containing protein [Thermobifida halotolerans]